MHSPVEFKNQVSTKCCDKNLNKLVQLIYDGKHDKNELPNINIRDFEMNDEMKCQ